MEEDVLVFKEEEWKERKRLSEVLLKEIARRPIAVEIVKFFWESRRQVFCTSEIMENLQIGNRVTVWRNCETLTEAGILDRQDNPLNPRRFYYALSKDVRQEDIEYIDHKHKRIERKKEEELFELIEEE